MICEYSLNILKDRIKPDDLKLYEGKNIFYLTDSKNNYLGHLEYVKFDLKNSIRVVSAYSKFRGFYKLVFQLILTETKIDYIFGDLQTNKKYNKILEKDYKLYRVWCHF